MAPKVSVDAKLEELHAFVSANVVSLAARTGDSLLRCFRQNASPTEKYWCTFLGRKMESFNDAQHGRLVDMYNLISRHRLRERAGGNDIEHLGEEVGSEPHRLAEQDEHRLAKLDDQSGERPGGNDIEGLGEEVGFEPHRLADQDEHRLAKLDDRAGLCKCSGGELCTALVVVVVVT